LFIPKLRFNKQFRELIRQVTEAVVHSRLQTLHPGVWLTVLITSCTFASQLLFMPNQQFLLYGANGYTAGLIIDLAARYGLQPVLGGRNEEKMGALARQTGLRYSIADLADAGAVDAMLQEHVVVLHCAGPFSATARPMQEACLRTGTHYLDITGEIAVFEGGAARHREALERNIMLMSGVGFDVVPTDCMALYLKQKLPDASHLRLAFTTRGGKVSKGTATTAAENLGAGGMVRLNGKLKPVPTAHKTIQVPFTGSELTPCMAIPWGDLSTAYHTTGIPNIETFMGASPMTIKLAKLSNYMNWLLSSTWFKQMLKAQINRTVTGAGAEARKAARSYVWGKAWNGKGEEVQALLTAPDGYTLTALAALTITKKVLDGSWQPGFQTPAGLYGPNLVLELEGVERQDLPGKGQAL
jgi:short subunit dehydrogenase-like uncharacterized protein